MNAEAAIRELLESCLVDNHHVAAVRFIDELLCVASIAGEIRCRMTDTEKLRFEIPGAAWEVELGRAKTKIRLLCARLSVLCNASGDQDVSIYGGEGIITPEADVCCRAAYEASVAGSLSAGVATGVTSACAPSTRVASGWTVRFTNTPAQQEFTITPR